MNVLILSCGTRCLLVDYFRKPENGFDRVVATDCSNNAPALYRADKYYIVPMFDSAEYIPEVLNICKKEDVDVVLPLNEDELGLIAKNTNVFLNQDILPVISANEIIELCHDKYRLYEFLKSESICVVPTFLLQNKENAYGKYGYPLFIKPRFGAGSVSNHIIYTEKMIDAIVESSEEEYIIQPYICGIEYGVNAYVDLLTGELTELFVLKKLRMRAGETEKSVSVYNDRIEEIIRRICDILPFKGPVDIDIVENNNEFYVLEINPRFGGAYPHTHECGINFVKLIANNANKKANKPFEMTYDENVMAFRYMSISTMKIEDMEYE